MVLWMDVCKIEPPGAGALRKSTEDCLRPPLAPSEKNNAIPVSRKPRTREVTSRNKSGVTTVGSPPHSTAAATRRCPSPNVGRVVLSPAPPFTRRSQSAERRQPTVSLSRASSPSPPSRSQALPSPPSRPSTPEHDVEVEMQVSSRRSSSGRAPDGLWPSMRNLSASFLSHSVSISLGKRDKSSVTNSSIISEAKSKSSSANVRLERKRSPSRGKNASDQSEDFKSVADQHRWPGIVNGKFSARAVSRSMDLTGGASGVCNSPAGSQGGASPISRAHISDGPTRGFQRTVNEVTGRTFLGGAIGPEYDFSTVSSASANVLGRTQSWSHPSRTLSSLPSAGSPRLSSPNMTSLPSSSSFRSTAGPCTKPLTPTSSRTSSGRIGISSSVLSYFANLRKGKKSSRHIEDAHQLQLLHNRCLQWRFVNARAHAAMSIKMIKAEKILQSMWITASGLRDSVILKRINMQQLGQEMKLGLILRDQMTYLEDSALLERDQCISLSGTIEALKARTLRLPVTGGARADAHALKDAISSAVDVMQAMGSFICQLLPGIDGTNSVASELAEVAARERAMLDECRELLTLAAVMQVQESSCRAHLLQLRQDIIRPKLPIELGNEKMIRSTENKLSFWLTAYR